MTRILKHHSTLARKGPFEHYQASYLLCIILHQKIITVSEYTAIYRKLTVSARAANGTREFCVAQYERDRTTDAFQLKTNAFLHAANHQSRRYIHAYIIVYTFWQFFSA
jgi:hypothetical protein